VKSERSTVKSQKATGRAHGHAARTAAAIVGAVVLLGTGAPAAAPARALDETGAPKLAVLIMVDQMRADYVDRFKGEWTHGLKRMLTRGAWFRRAAYPYLTTVTCAGHATVSTGAFPSTHGIIQNAWWDAERHQMTTCTEDPKASNVGYGVQAKGGDSAWRLTMPTFADAMRTERGAHVVTVSLKARSAIMLAGHGGDAVTWLSDSLDGWVTSSVFTETPVPAVKAFTDANRVDADYGKTWALTMPAARYEGIDDAVGETPPRGWTRRFPHLLSGSNGAPDAEYRAQWERSPYADAYLGRFAAALVESLQLGRHDKTDVLGVSFSSPDLVGHGFGPRSQEIEDMYLHLDETIGTLLDRLDALVGPDEYVVALTADHGETPLPEQLKQAGQDAGRLDANAIRAVVEKEAEAALGGGPRTYVARENGNDISLEDGVYARLSAKAGAVQRVVDALGAVPGIARVFRREDVAGGASSRDPLLRAAALSYFPGRSGELIVVPKPGWIFAATGATHGSASTDDQRVPILFMGHGIKPGQYMQASTPADVAPTLAAVCGISLRKADCHALTAALKAANPRSHTPAPPAGK
jgi:predicted AlkP superfamily pyrophosphatase or phosphodiesterase